MDPALAVVLVLLILGGAYYLMYMNGGQTSGMDGKWNSTATVTGGLTPGTATGTTCISGGMLVGTPLVITPSGLTWGNMQATGAAVQKNKFTLTTVAPDEHGATMTATYNRIGSC